MYPSVITAAFSMLLLFAEVTLAHAVFVVVNGSSSSPPPSPALLLSLSLLLSPSVLAQALLLFRNKR